MLRPKKSGTLPIVMLQIKDLHTQVGDQKILKGVSLEVEENQIHVILGPNGSGKSTLGRVIMGDPTHQVTQGQIHFKGQNCLELAPHQRAQEGLFLSFQTPPAVEGVKVKDLLFSAQKNYADPQKSQFRFKRTLQDQGHELRLESEALERETHKGFSGGEQKKVEMMTLFTLRPQLAILDEIDSGVDVDTLHIIAQKLKTYLAEDTTRSLILISHSEKILKEITPTHVHVCAKGKIIHSGGVEVIKQVHEKGFDGFLGEKKGGLPTVNSHLES